MSSLGLSSINLFHCILGFRYICMTLLQPSLKKNHLASLCIIVLLSCLMQMLSSSFLLCFSPPAFQQQTERKHSSKAGAFEEAQHA